MEFDQPKITYGKPFDEMLPVSTFLHIADNQKILDAEFLKIANRQPSLLDRHNALLDERGEFYNEFKNESKYWANKVNDSNKILDEHSDILHFFVGWMLHRMEENNDTHYEAEYQTYLHHHRVIGMAYEREFNKFNFEVSNLFNRSPFEMFIELLHRGRVTSDPFEITAIATYVLSFSFDKHDIYVAYNAKRDENYKRIERTAKGMNDR